MRKTLAPAAPAAVAGLATITSTLRYAYRGWEVRISLHGVPAQGEVHASADLLDQGRRRHSIVLQHAYQHGAAALRAASAQARAFIDGGQAAACAG